MRKYREIDNQLMAGKVLASGGVIERYAFQCVDFNEFIVDVENVTFHDCLFLGCRFTKSMHYNIDGSNVVLTSLKVPFNVFKTTLYNRDTLYNAYDCNRPDTLNDTYDSKVYRHYLATGIHADDINETLARTLHDHSMSDALHDFLDGYAEKDIVAVMGGHALSRRDKAYRQIVMVSKMLAEHGKLMVSGGGPGAMEATHLGAWLAGRSNDDVDAACICHCN